MDLLLRLIRSFSKNSKPTQRKPLRDRNKTFRYETLEPKQLLAGITFQNGVITINGTPARDVATVDVLSSARIQVKLNRLAPQIFNSAQVARIVFHGGNGNDRFQNNTGKPSEAHGGAGNDTLVGGWGDDILNGGQGNDKLFGRDGNDRLNGGEGIDQINGGNGQDTAVYAGNHASYRYAKSSRGISVIFANRRSELTKGIEIFQFANGPVSAANILQTSTPAPVNNPGTVENNRFTEAEIRSRNLLNSYRQSQGRSTLAENTALNTFAENWSLEMINRGAAHSTDAQRRQLALNNGFQAIGEIISFAPGHLDRNQAVDYFHQFWINSSDHRPFMIDARFRFIGVGVTYGGGLWYGTQIFGG